ncbi:toll/interleukin-1 receptor domain-containing protein [Nodosilinea sp. P-1105]|uniref:toll/interleukin-1 receptor domain-containing protein n=1 Tax=Nodosilinea sp. P-1105 TaxID=2546229 RepID=UPI00146F8373|nr:toll/interleukin-1 receptor domain-containing protein [Nodosilinea sp. P-1105]NMF82431.1 toll/interleukin-1 receptor domain-containing protein [Nodosilinea sp. P-1105]
MAYSLFISYSRRETPFVVGLLEGLERAKLNVWLDFRNLMPGHTWKTQITDAIAQQDIFLLVVSPASMASANVEYEWRHAMALKKRIILLIFEATPLPDDLKLCEWVDFRQVSMPTATKRLIIRLSFPQPTQMPVPETGFEAPFIVWVTCLVSVIVAVITIPSVWTIYLPYYLLPLPYRILKRDFSFFNVQGALIMLPFSTFWTGIIFVAHETIQMATIFMFLLSLIFSPLLWLLLRLPGMRQWGKPVASRPRFPNRYQPDADSCQPVTFTVDAAPEDSQYAQDIIHQLEQSGHQYVTDAEACDLVILLLSAFKTSSAFNPQTQIVYPVILQDVDGIDPRFGAIQWIDFRRGLGNIKAFSRLLSQPEKLLHSLGIVPAGRQVVLPPAVQAISFYLTFIGIFFVASLLFTLGIERFTFHPVSIAILVAIAATFLAIVTFTRTSLISRRGYVTSGWSLLAAMVGLGVCVGLKLLVVLIEHSQLPQHDFPTASQMSVYALFGAMLAYGLGLVYVVFWSLLYWQDLRRWFPRRPKHLM